MNAFPVSRHLFTEQDAVVVYDVDRCIRSWGRRGILSGGLFGVVLGAIFVASPLTADTLTFGTIGTLFVCAIECAVVAGAFGASIAAFKGQGIRRSDMTQLDWIRATSRGREDHQSSDMNQTGRYVRDRCAKFGGSLPSWVVSESARRRSIRIASKK